MFKNKNKSEVSKTSFFSDKIDLEGVLVSNGNVLLEGSFKGKIYADKLSTSSSAKFEGSVIVKDLVVGGSLSGDFQISDNLEVLSTGGINGEVRTGSLLIEDGALIDAGIDILSPPNNNLTPSPALKKPGAPIVHRN